MEMTALNKNQLAELERITEFANNGEIHRMGKLFSSNQNNYFYDTGTGKVVLLNDDEHYFLSIMFTCEKVEFLEFEEKYSISFDSLNTFFDAIYNENLFRAKKPIDLYTPNHIDNFDTVVENNLEQLILEVTAECNLRCRYCTYNESIDINRNFSSSSMSKKVAMQAIDYALSHSGSDLSIAFYGGEPLLNFDLVKWAVLYAEKEKIIHSKKISYTMTTNLTLMTEEFASFFSSISSFNILCSIDGPMDIHDSNRINKNGDGSYSAAIRGLMLLADKYKGSNNVLSINVVFAPPYTYEKLDQIESYFSNLNFLPENLQVDITYPTKGSILDTGFMKKTSSNPKYRYHNTDQINPLWNWQVNKFKKSLNNGLQYKSISTSGLDQILLRINNRYISDNPSDIYPLHGCCVPGQRRLYVDTMGLFYVCERIGTLSPSIGDINKGIDKKVIKDVFIDDYIKKSIIDCSKCWAIRMCTVCYDGRVSNNGFNCDNETCSGVRDIIEKHLIFYHDLLESDPEKLEFLKKMELV